MQWFSDIEVLKNHLRALKPETQRIEKEFQTATHALGYCIACDKEVDFVLSPAIANEWRDLRARFTCPTCGLNGTMRGAYHLICETFLAIGTNAMCEQTTPLFHAIIKKFSNVIGSEYLGEDKKPGEIIIFHGDTVRHETLHALSFDDNSIDAIWHGDVLEHVPDYLLAIQECARVLKENGKMIFTAPFFDIPKHKIRCKEISGEIQHFYPPAYHGNPISEEGSLVYTEFGWPLVDEILKNGFSECKIGLHYDTSECIVTNGCPYDDGHMFPLYFLATK